MAFHHHFDPMVLREYDIRGTVGRNLFPQDAYAIGRAFATVVAGHGGGRVAVGYDGRLSSPELEGALVKGLLDGGIEVRRIGRGPTPLLYYADRVMAADGAVMVTGSHNPPDHNGFKLVLGGKPFFGGDIQRLGEIAAAGRVVAGQGSVIDQLMVESYVHRLAEDYDGERPLTVVWDAGNGAAGEVMKRLVRHLPGRHVLLNAQIDGSFPAHHPDPSEPRNMAQLQDAVLTERADLGVAFDGDADRLGIVDNQGRILWGDQILLLLAEDLLAHHPGATVIADVKASQVLFDEVERLGGVPMMWKTGHSWIKAKMAETGAILAGEMTGHIFFADRYYGFDDALYAAVRFISMVARWSHEDLGGRYDRLPHLVNTPELRIDCAEERKFAVVAEVRERLAAAGADIVEVDGLRVRTPDGWWLLRASNTQAALGIRCEAASAAGLAALKRQLAEQLRQSRVAPPFD